MASVWSWTDGFLKGFCSCTTNSAQTTSEPININKEEEKQQINNNNLKLILSTKTTSLDSNDDNNNYYKNNIWNMDQSWCFSTIGRNTTTTLPNSTCYQHYLNNNNGTTKNLVLSASFASPIGPPSFLQFNNNNLNNNKEMKQRRRVTNNGDFIGLIEKMQSQRMDDQRCQMPSKNNKLFFKTSIDKQNGKATDCNTFGKTNNNNNNLQRLSSKENGGAIVRQILSNPGPYPQIVVTKGEDCCGFWLDGAIQLNEETEKNGSFSNVADFEIRLETDDEAAFSYRKHFLGREHHNFYALDSLLGPLILSVRVESIPSSNTSPNSSSKTNNQQQQEQNFRIILRSRLGTKHKLVPSTAFNNSRPCANQMAKLLYTDVSIERFWPVAFPGGSELILQFDEHVINNTYKFGVIYQKFGQTTEEELFGNTCSCKQFDDFLELLGDRVPLRNFEGYRGGLDTIHGQTGNESIYSKFSQKEVMFHISTLLPYTLGDVQQLQRKRHIGNDIVAVVFQEKNTPFCPEMIQSNFLHSFLVVQPIENDDNNSNNNNYFYRVSISARNDVPLFGPQLPSTIISGTKDELRTFFLTKLINAENAALKADKFAKLAERTRSSLLDGLYNGLKERAQFYGVPFLESIDQQQQQKPNNYSSSSSTNNTPSKICNNNNNNITTKQQQNNNNQILLKDLNNNNTSNNKNNNNISSTNNNNNVSSSLGLFSSVKKAFANTRSRSVSQDIASSSSFLQQNTKKQFPQQQQQLLLSSLSSSTTSTINQNNNNNNSSPILKNNQNNRQTTTINMCPSISSGSCNSSCTNGYYCSSSAASSSSFCANSSSTNTCFCLNNIQRPPLPQQQQLPHSPRQGGASKRILAREQSRVASLAMSDDCHLSSASSTASSQIRNIIDTGEQQQQPPPPRWRAGALGYNRQAIVTNRGCTSMVFDNEMTTTTSSSSSSTPFSTNCNNTNINKNNNKRILYPQHSLKQQKEEEEQQINYSLINNSNLKRLEREKDVEFLSCSSSNSDNNDDDYDEDVEVEVEEVVNSVANEQHDSDTGMESMSSGDLHNSFNTERAASIFNGRQLKLNNKHEAEEKRLEELVVDVVKLKNEKGELLRQNVTCRTDIKKLKERQSLLATELNKANDEIQRLKKLINSSDDILPYNNNSVNIMYFDDEEIIINNNKKEEEDLNLNKNLKILKDNNNVPLPLPSTSTTTNNSPSFFNNNQHLFSAEQ